MSQVYDTIGVGYASRRRPEPRIEALLHAALGDARRVVNVGAGAGSYEPPTTVVAVEPSLEMIAQRPSGRAPAVRAVAERLPLATDSADAALAVLTTHHWRDLDRGVAEMLRVAPRAVILTWDADVSFWLMNDYLTETLAWDRARFVPLSHYVQRYGADARVVPIPKDCVDGFLAAYWARPEAYLSAPVRASMSCFAQRPEPEWEPALRRLDAEVRSGAWAERYADLLAEDTLDAGYRLLVIER